VGGAPYHVTLRQALDTLEPKLGLNG
jgi:hypothetical protein